MEYKVGLRLISNALKGVIIKIINIESGEKSGNYLLHRRRFKHRYQIE